MDHYYISIYEDSLSIEDQQLFVKHMKSLLPTEGEIGYCWNLASHISPILNRKFAYVANINTSSSKFKKCLWTKICDIGTHNFFLPNFTKNGPCDHNTLEPETSLCLSETVHALADQLPQSGTFHLDVLLSCNILKDVEISHHLDLAGAFHRLSVWHHASFSVIGQSMPHREWSQIINVHVVSKSEMRNAVIWRGSISMKQEVPECENWKWLQLTLDDETSKRWLTLNDVLNLKSRHTQMDNAIVLSPEIEFLDECCIETVPPYMFSPVNFTLTLTGKSEESHNSYLLSYLNSDAEVCLVLRLKYSILQRPSINSYNVHMWKEAVSNGNIHSLKCNMEADNEHHVILIANKNRHLTDAVFVYLLNDLCQLNAKISYNILAIDSLSESKFFGTTLEKCAASVNKLSHCNSRETFAIYLRILGECQVQILADYIRHRKENMELSVQEIRVIFNSIQDLFFSHLKLKKEAFSAEKFPHIDSSEMDPSNWPERLQLLQNQVEAGKKNRLIGHLSQSSIMPPPQKVTAVMAAKDIGKLFNEFGEASAETKAEVISVRKQVFYGNYKVQGTWPDMLHKLCHDVFYNCGQASEEAEISRAMLKDRLVVSETASICSNAHLPPFETIPPIKNEVKHSPPSPLKTNERKSSFLESRQIHGRAKSSKPQKETCGQQQTDLINSQNITSSKRKSFTPLLRSPEKHPAPVSTKGNKIIKKVENLSEKHKMKLREAVAIALEESGINLDHSMFKPCARKLFAVCKPYMKDIIGKGSTSSQMRRIAAAHVKQVMDFEMQKS